ncbi:MAG: SIMPL domain-containing protein [Alphaproteobacteria bacterium]
MDYTKLMCATVIAAGLAAGGYFTGHYYYAAKMNDRTVVVKGLAETDAKADLAIWNIKFLSTGNDLKAAQGVMQKNLGLIKRYLAEKGFADTEIIVGRINTNDLMANPYRNNNMQGPRYILNQTVTVRSTQVDKVETSLRGIGVLVSEGVIFDNQEYGSPVSYLFTGLNTIKPAMLQQATENARKAAEEFAKSSDSRVGNIKRANQGVFSIGAREQAPDTSESAEINKTVRVVSTVEYYLK